MTDEHTIIVNCSNCRKPLISIMAGKDNPEKKTRIRAKCSHCGDQSFIKTVDGDFFLGSTDYSYIESTEDSELESVDVMVNTIVAAKRNKDD